MERRNGAELIEPVVIALPKEQYGGYAIDFSYRTEEYYAVQNESTRKVMMLDFVRKQFEQPVEKHFTDHLYEPWVEDAEAFGVLDAGSLAAVIEMGMERWNNRARVAELWVREDCRRRGWGRMLFRHGIAWAIQKNARALVLETQSCNVPAIDFYRAMGMELIGCDLTAYSNRDMQMGEVRLEMGLPLSR